ncbi:hypothetical protein MMC14_006338 [Varicellaria rhodocarpa]|nr:hypothetical protein [Varicellaria rhodocarpa]
MHVTSRSILKAVWIGLIGAVTATPSVTLNPADFSPKNVIRRDVCIIGGGSTGTYSAVQLSDMGKSVIIVEAVDRLGGHTETYTDPTTNTTIDIGVLEWHQLDIVKKYLARFNIPLTIASSSSPGVVNEYADFSTGKIVSGFTPPNFTEALGEYVVQAAKYPDLGNGFYLPDPVPEDLLLPYGEFIKKYSLESFAYFHFNFAQGLGNLFNQLTLYVFKNFGLDVIRDLSIGFLVTAQHDNSALYEAAQAELSSKDAVLLQSRVIAMDRNTPSQAKVLVQTPSGPKLIIAQKIILTIPPKLNNLHGWDLSHQETELFSQFKNSGYWTGLLRNTGIPDNVSLTNTGANTQYNVLDLPGAYGFSPTSVPGLRTCFYGSDTSSLSDAQVQANIIAEVKRLHTAGTFTTPATEPEFAIFSAHTPFELTVSAEAIRAGFYTKLYALQGQRNTFYTGAAFHTHDSSLLWQFTQALLPSVVGNLTGGA